MWFFSQVFFLAPYLKRWNSLNGLLLFSLPVLRTYLKCDTALYAIVYATLVLSFKKKKSLPFCFCGLQTNLGFGIFCFSTLK